MAKIIEELKIMLRLDDRASGEIKKASDEAKKSVDGLGTSFSKMKSALAAAGFTLLAGFLLRAADAFQTLSNGMVRAANTFRLTEGQVRDLNYRLVDMAKQSVFTTEELSQGLDRLATSGLNASQSLALLQGAIELSQKSGVDLNKIIEFQSYLLRNKLVDSEEEAEKLAKQLADAAQELGVPFEDLAKSFIENATNAMKAGVSLEELIRLMATDVQALGLVDGLNALNVQLRALTGDPEALKQMAFLPEALRVKPGDTVDMIIGNIVNYLANMDAEKIAELERLKKAATVAGETTLADILTKIANISEEDLKKIIRIGLVTDFNQPEGDSTQAPTFSKMIGDFMHGLDVGIGQALTGAGQFLGSDQYQDARKRFGPSIGDKPLGQAIMEAFFPPESEDATQKSIEARQKEAEEAEKVSQILETLRGQTEKTGLEGMDPLTTKTGEATDSVDKFSNRLTQAISEIDSAVGSAKNFAQQAQSAAASAARVDRELRDNYRSQTR